MVGAKEAFVSVRKKRAAAKKKAPAKKKKVREIELDSVERFAMDKAVQDVQAAQAQAQGVAANIAAHHGWDPRTRLSYEEGKLVEAASGGLAPPPPPEE